MRLIDADELVVELAEHTYDNKSFDEILDNIPTIKAIPKADYENRLKADMAAMLEDFDLQIDEFDSGCGWDGYIKKIDVHEIIQQKINALKENEDG